MCVFPYNGLERSCQLLFFLPPCEWQWPHSLHQDVARDTTSETENRPTQDTTFASSVILDFTDGIKAAKIDHVTLGYHDFQYKLCFIQTTFRYIQCNVL